MGRKPDIFDTLETLAALIRHTVWAAGILWVTLGPWVALAFHAWLSQDWIIALVAPSTVLLFIPCIAPIVWICEAYGKAKANYRSHK